jgi:hypothetical protein
MTDSRLTCAPHVIVRVIVPMRESLHPPALWVEIFVGLLGPFVGASASSVGVGHRARTLTAGRIPGRHSDHL